MQAQVNDWVRGWELQLRPCPVLPPCISTICLAIARPRRAVEPSTRCLLDQLRGVGSQCRAEPGKLGDKGQQDDEHNTDDAAVTIEERDVEALIVGEFSGR